MTPLQAATAAAAGTTRRKWERHIASSRPAGPTRPATGSGLTAPAGSARLAAPARSARLLLDEDEVPLVVVIAPLVQADRLFLALAAHAKDAARNGAAAESAPLRLRPDSSLRPAAD